VTDAHCHVSGGDPSVRELLIGRDFVGVHPWAALGDEMGRMGAGGGIGAGGVEGVCAWLREKLLSNPRLGVGEIGLDRLKEKAISPAMRELFVAQLALAFEFRRPVVLHGAKCWGEVVKEIIELSNNRIIECGEGKRIIELADHHSKIRKFDYSIISPFLFHGFSRSDGLLPDIVRLNGYVSVGPAVLNDHAVNYRELVKKIPLDRLLVETDRDCAPEELLNPVTKAPLTIRDVLEKTAELRGLSLAELESVTDANAARFL
jgi:Tat protein secretion system quality control protein TatD with DNase activity